MKPNVDQKLCESRDYFWPIIRNLAKQFEEVLIEKINENEKLKENLVFFQLDIKKLESAFKIYERGWWTFKQHVYGENAEEERIDRHKIIALYILSFLIERPFSIRTKLKKENSDKKLLYLANELFSLEIMMELLRSWNGDDNIFKMDKNEKRWFLILLNCFKLEMMELNTSYISDKPSDESDVLSLSQIIYYIEKSYLSKLSKPFKKESKKS